MAKLEKKDPPDNIELAEIDDSKHPNPAQRCPSSKGCNKANCRKPWHRPYSKSNVVAKLRPVLIFIGCAEAILGSILLVVMVMFATEFDRLYGVEKSKTMSLLCFGGLVAMAVSGTLLLISVQLDKRSIMWFYVVASTFICVYIFGVAVIMMQNGLFNVPILQIKFEFPNTSTSTPASNLSTSTMKPLHLFNPVEPVPCTMHGNSFLFGKAFVISLLTLIGSVAHFVGTVTVFTFYNLKYVHPLLFYCHTQDL